MARQESILQQSRKVLRVIGIFFALTAFGSLIKDAQAADYSGEYWNLGSAQTSPSFPGGDADYTSTDSAINFDWGNGSPDASVDNNGFVARWTKTETLYAGDYTFNAGADDGVRVYVDNVLVIDAWVDQGYTTYEETTAITAGSHEIKVEYYENGGDAVVTASYDAPPGVTTLSPTDDATAVAPTDNLVMTFSENITAVASKDITIKKTSGDSTVETIAADDTSKVTVSSNSVTINPDTVLDDLTSYYVLIDSGAFIDGSSKDYAGITETTAWNFTTADTTDPTISTLSPANSATNVATTANMIITFDEIVNVESDNVTIFKTAGDLMVEAIDVTSGQVTGDGTTTITIDPTDALEEETSYYIQVDATAFDDTSGNSFAGISDTTTWNFTAADETNPSIVSVSPVDGDTKVTLDTNLVITFSEAVDVESGSITIRRSLDNSVAEDLIVISSRVTGTGTTIITVDPVFELTSRENYYIRIDASAFDDSTSNGYAGLFDAATWNFTTVDTGGSGEPVVVQESSAEPSSPTVVVPEVVKKAPVKEEVEVELILMPLVAIIAQPRVVYFPKTHTAPEIKEDVVVDKQDIEIEMFDNEIIDAPKSKELVKPVPLIGKDDNAKINNISSSTGHFINKITSSIKTTWSHVIRIPTRVINLATNTYDNVLSRTATMSGNLMAKFKAPEKQEKHIYKTVVVKLATADGRPMAGATVTLFSDPKTETSNEDGRVEFHNIESGDHKLNIKYQGYTSKQSIVLDDQIEEITINITAEFKKESSFRWF
jgi:methionine-rich copper-binding protein CopC